MDHRAKFNQNRAKGAEIWWFNGFQDGDRPHQHTKFWKDRSKIVVEISWFLWFSRRRLPPSWIVKNSKFYRSIRCKGPVCVIMPNFIKIGQTVAEIWQFNGFKMATVRHLGFCNSNSLTAGAVKIHIVHQYTKFCKDRSYRCGGSWFLFF